MRFIRVQDHHLADPLVVYLFRPRQVPQPSVVIFLELSVANFILHADKYPDLPRAGNACFGLRFATSVKVRLSCSMLAVLTLPVVSALSIRLQPITTKEKSGVLGSRGAEELLHAVNSPTHPIV